MRIDLHACEEVYPSTAGVSTLLRIANSVVIKAGVTIINIIASVAAHRRIPPKAKVDPIVNRRKARDAL